MGYYAAGSGFAKIEDKENRNKLIKAFTDSMYNFGTIEMYNEDDGVSICVEYQRYYEEDYEELFKIMANYTDECSIEFVGDDNEHWRLYLNNGKMDWIQGKVIYDMSDYSDQELIDELDRRGFGITQLFNLAQSM